MLRLIKHLIIFLTAACCTLLLLEIYLRSAAISLPSYTFDDPEYGRSLKPDSPVFDIKGEGFCIDKVNKLGYLGPPYPEAKKENTVRIALIGDSYVEALQVFERHRFRSILERNLNSITDIKRVQVFNFGLGGIDFRDMYYLYHNKIKPYQPDYMLYFIKNEDFYKANHIAGPKLYIDNDSLKADMSFKTARESKIREQFKFIRNFSIGNLLKEAFEYYYYGRTMDILFEKLNPFRKEKTESVPCHEGEDQYYPVNKMIIKKLSRGQETCQPVFIIANELDDHYIALFERFDLTYFDLNQYLKQIEEKGEHLKYWKASQRQGHWNHRAHHYIGDFLTIKFTKLLNL